MLTNEIFRVIHRHVTPSQTNGTSPGQGCDVCVFPGFLPFDGNCCGTWEESFVKLLFCKMISNGQVVVFAINVLFGVCAENFYCGTDQRFCFWTRTIPSNWITAYTDCTQTGGSLVSSEYSAYIEEWMSSMNISFASGRVWSSLHRINHRFQLLHHQPEFLSIAPSEWVPGHPLLQWFAKRDCVVVNQRMLYESVDCDDSFPFICAISINRKNELNNLDLPRGVIQVKLEADPKGFQQRIVTNHLEIKRNETNLVLRCNVTYNGARKLEYSWIKDGIFLGKNDSVVIHAFVHDKSKVVSDGGPYAIYQKQGTYQCQVKEFGAVEVTTSNAIIVTYQRVLNGIVSISLFNVTKNSVNIDAIMGKVRDFIHENVLSDHLKLNDVETSWDPLYSLPLRSGGIEYRYSLYVDSVRQYPDTTLYHFLDVISEKVGNSIQLRSLLQVEKISVQWATYCARENVTVSGPNSPKEFQSFWPSSWSTPTAHPTGGKILCVYEDNRAELLTRQCLPDFSLGATFTPLSVKKCARLITEPDTRCKHGYQWMESMQLCFKVTESGSWNETMAACMNDWPLNDTESIDYTTHHSLVAKYLQTGTNFQGIWLPVRRSSVYGPILYYSSINNAPESLTWTAEIETWRGSIEEDECLLLTQNSDHKVSSCSEKAIPSVCAHRPRLTASPDASINLCLPPWNGYIIEQGRLTCFRLVQSEIPMDWKQANQRCNLENRGITANVSMATFEHAGKVHAWNVARSSKHFSKLKSAWIGLFWSDAKQKFCWVNFEIDCLFEHFNWHPSTNWTAGHYGIMEESWDLLPYNSGLRNQVLCQAVIYLDAAQNIRVRSDKNDIIRVVSNQEMYQNPTPQSFDDLSEFFSLGWRPWISDNLPAINVGIDIRCYLDGETIKTISLFPAEFSLRPSFKKGNAFNCEGWIGWPRRFVRSEPIIVLHPPNSYIYVMLLDSHQVQSENQNNSINFLPDPLADISRRLERLDANGATVLVTGYRRWSYNQKTRFLVRMVITSSSPHRNWPELVKNELHYQPTEEGYHHQVLYIRDSDACQEETLTVFGTSKLLNITWATTPIGFTTESLNPCEAVDGYPILRKCLGTHNTGAFWEPFTNQSLQFNNVTCREATNVLTKLRQLTDDVFTNNTNPSEALVTLAEIAGTQWTEETSEASNNVRTGVEFGQAARLLHASVQRIQQPSVREFQDVSQTLTAMLTSPNQLEQAQSLPGVSNSLMESLERVMSHVNVPKEQDSVIFHHPKMATESIRNPRNVVGYGANLGGKDNLEIQNGSRILQNRARSDLVEELVRRDIAIILPVDEIRRREGLSNSNATSLRLSFSVFPNADIFDARPVTSLSNSDASMAFVVDSPIIVAQVGNSVISNLNQSVRIFFRSRSQHNLSVQPVCVFWDKFSSISGGWSSFGCQYVGRSQDLYICECNHLTPLALLFPYFDKEQTMDYRHRLALSLISVVGCVASMIGLSLVILTFLLFRQWRKSLGNKILFNFSLALFGVTGCFLCAGLVKFDSRMCKTTAASMHYFLLASFAWMAVEGVYQYLNYVVIIGAQNYKSCFMRRASPLAWGLPILPVLGIFIYDPDQYAVGDNFCWIKLETFYIVVLAPVSIILLFNIMIFIGILRSVVCLRFRSKLRTSQSVTTRSWYEFRMAVCVFFLLGLAWVFGFVSIGDARLVFAYLFCIFNSMQGFAIFIFFVFRERNARKLWFEFTRVCGEQKLISTNKTPSRSSDYVLKPASKY